MTATDRVLVSGGRTTGDGKRVGDGGQGSGVGTPTIRVHGLLVACAVMGMNDFNRDTLLAADSFGVTVTAEFLSAVLVWALIGFGLDRWLDTGPVLFSGGVFLGFGLGMYLAFLRYQQESAKDDAARTGL